MCVDTRFRGRREVVVAQSKHPRKRAYALAFKGGGGWTMVVVANNDHPRKRARCSFSREGGDSGWCCCC